MLSSNILGTFLEQANALTKPRVLEIGTKRVVASEGTIRKHWIPNAGEYIGTDAEEGLDVDVVSDAHSLSSTFEHNYFDVVLSCSVFEHLKFPWIVSTEIARVLKMHGLLFVHTHNAFPLHGYPHDYWRYTRESLSALFSEVSGFECLGTEYEFPCQIVADRDPNIANGEAFLNVLVFARKVAHPDADVSFRKALT